MIFFKAARLWDPRNIEEYHGSVTAWCDATPVLKTLVPGLVAELPAYRAKAKDVEGDVDVLRWWRKWRQELPKWAEALRIVALVQPSSAGIERLFSELKHKYTVLHGNALNDFIESCTLTAYNDRQRSKADE